MKDGHLNKCKGCSKKDVIENRKNEYEYYVDYDKKRFQEPDRRAYSYKKVQEFKEKNTKKSSEYNKTHYLKSKDHKRDYLKMYRKENPEKYKAHRKVYYAIKTGKLFKEPCAVCGNKDVHAHHEDYSKPLDVIWLCVKHHMHEHIALE